MELGYDRATPSGRVRQHLHYGHTVAIDGFSRFVVLEPASDASGESVARFLLKLQVVGWFGRPKGIMIRTDGGSQYDNHLIDVLCHLLGFE